MSDSGVSTQTFGPPQPHASCARKRPTKVEGRVPTANSCLKAAEAHQKLRGTQNGRYHLDRIHLTRYAQKRHPKCPSSIDPLLWAEQKSSEREGHDRPVAVCKVIPVRANPEHVGAAVARQAESANRFGSGLAWRHWRGESLEIKGSSAPLAMQRCGKIGASCFILSSFSLSCAGFFLFLIFCGFPQRPQEGDGNLSTEHCASTHLTSSPNLSRHICTCS